MGDEVRGLQTFNDFFGEIFGDDAAAVSGFMYALMRFGYVSQETLGKAMIRRVFESMNPGKVSMAAVCWAYSRE